MTTQAAFEGDLDDVLLALEDAMPGLLTACKTVEEQRTLMARRDALRDIFWKAKAGALEDFNATVEHLAGELKIEIASLKHELQQLKEVAAVLAPLTEVIKLAGAIVTTAAV
jgi:hypothetical protein